ncbi:retrovirus-related Pol polyprotein from transposon 297 [Trichonephila clavipes]|nr:retrovirus-related Pol polyprotein from transposon 297 [Trichonephila clavipes]
MYPDEISFDKLNLSQFDWLEIEELEMQLIAFQSSSIWIQKCIENYKISCIPKQQKPNGNQHPIAFHSRRLRNYEINYTLTELECLAIIDSLDKFHCYLHGSHFTVHTDPNALVWLKNFKNSTGRLFRWSLKVSMYDFDIKYKKGRTNVEADMLTRNPIAYHIINTPPEPLLDINKISHFQNIENTSAPKCFKGDGVFVVKRQGLTKIIVPKALRVKLMETTQKKFGHPGVATMLKLISPQYYWINIITDIRNYVKHCETCQINKKSHQRKYGLMQSLPLREKPFELLSIDSVGHIIENNKLFPSPSKTKSVVIYPEPKTTKEVQRFLGLTGYFRKFIPAYSVIAKPLSDLLRKDTPFNFDVKQKASFDELKRLLCQKPVLGIYRQNCETEIHTDASIDELAVVILQRFPDDNTLHPIYYMSRKTSETERKYTSYELEVLAIIEALKKFKVYILGMPFKIITDCNAFTKTMSLPRANGQVERINRTIIPVLSKMSEDDPTKWFKHVPSLQEVLNSTFQRSINTTPFELLFGTQNQ